MRKILKGKSLWIVTYVMLILGVLWSLPAHSAENSRLIPFQGRLTDAAGEPLNGVRQITFVIYDEPTGGNALWVEVHESVSVINGQLNVLLGSMTLLDDPDGNGDPSDAIQFMSPRFLGIKVGEGSNQEMVPRQQLVPAFHARTADQAKEADHATEANNADTLDGHDSSYFASSLVPSGLISMWAGSVQNIPSGWALCDGTNGAPDLRDQFILGAASGENPGAIGGANSITLSVANLPSHTHSIEGDTGIQSHNHTHSGETSGAGSHAHSLKNESGPEGGGAPEQGSWSSGYTGEQTGSAGYHTHAFTTGGNSGNHIHHISFTSGSSGSGSAIENRPAFYKLAFIMKL
jgi:microcystin-dependent protein